MKHLAHIPPELRTAPWLKSILGLLQEQTQIIQAQTEQIAALQQTVQTLKDEIARLTKTPESATGSARASCWRARGIPF